MINIRLLSALNNADDGEIDVLAQWLADGVIEVSRKEGDLICGLRLVDTEYWWQTMPEATA